MIFLFFFLNFYHHIYILTDQQVTEATQPYTMDVDLPKPGMEEATQAYTIEVEDTTVPEEESVDEEGDVTPPIEDVLAATQPYSKEEEVGSL